MYAWRPSSCSLVYWNAHRFCSLLGRRRLLFLGDSIMQQLAATVSNHVRWGYSWNGSQTDTPCQDQIWFAIGDSLLGRPMGTYERGLHFTEWVRELKPHVVVLGTNNHIYGSSNFTRVLEEVAVAIAGFPE
eukprot:982062-Prymnesium_polylepis.1